jgi:hypothetical protein
MPSAAGTAVHRASRTTEAKRRRRATAWWCPLLLLPLAVPLPAARAGSDLNPDIETMCKGLAIINDELGATAAPGTPMGQRMQTELALSPPQYGALWSLMKLTPTPTCTKLY